ncbi:hypothetical protein As57867_009370, partial [Aphanomyces stellatus]
ALIYRLSRCNAGDITAIANFFTAYVNIFGGTDESDAYDSTMLYNLVALSELFTYPTPSRASLVASYLNTTIASDTSDLVTLYCLASGGTDAGCRAEPKSPNKFKFVYPTDKYFDMPITIPTGTSVLLLSGLMDPQTPAKFARYQFDSFNGTAKKLIEFPASAHGTILNTPVTVQNKVPCGAAIVSSFVMHGLGSLETSCMDYLVPLSFNISAGLAQRFMATTDAYDGTPKGVIPKTGPSSASSSGNGSTIAFKVDDDSHVPSSWRVVAIVGIVGMVLLVAAVAFLVVRLRRDREASKLPAAVDYANPSAM